MEALTERQEQIYDLIVESIRTRGYPPTFQEMMAKLGISSPNGIECSLKAIEKKGWITRNGKPRRIMVVPTSRHTIAGLRSLWAQANEDTRRAFLAWTKTQRTEVPHAD